MVFSIGVVLLAAVLAAASPMVCATLVALALLAAPLSFVESVRHALDVIAQRLSLFSVTLLRGPPALSA